MIFILAKDKYFKFEISTINYLISNQSLLFVTKIDKKTLRNIKNDCKFAAASPTQLAPFESPRVGTQQGY